MRCGRARTVSASLSLAAATSVVCSRTSDPCGTTRDRSLALGATCPAALSRTRSSENAEPGHKLSNGLFVPVEGPGHWPGAACKVMAAACSGRSARASSPSTSGSASQVWPMSSTSTLRRVSIFISRAMMVCSSASSSSWVGAPFWRLFAESGRLKQMARPAALTPLVLTLSLSVAATCAAAVEVVALRLDRRPGCWRWRSSRGGRRRGAGPIGGWLDRCAGQVPWLVRPFFQHRGVVLGQRPHLG